MIERFWDVKTARVLFTALIFVMVLAFLRGARETLTLFLFAVLFAYLVNPVVSLLQKLLHGRIRAILAFYVLFLGLITGLSFFFGPSLAGGAKSLLGNLPALVDRIATGHFIVTLSHNQGWDQARQLQIQHFFMSHRDQILAYVEGLAGNLEAPLSHLWWLILIPILGLFFLKDASTIAHELVDFGTERQERSTIRRIIGDVHTMLASYIRAQFILAALTAVALSVVLGLMRVPYAFVLSPLAGLCEFIPVVGPAVACVAIFGIAAVIGYNHLLWIFLFLGTWRVIQDYVNAPRIMGNSLEISPLLEIFGVLAGGEIGGVVGALVAVPILALLRILWIRLNVPDTAAAAPVHASAAAPKTDPPLTTAALPTPSHVS